MLIVGAAGVFGSRLARLLAQRQAFRVTLAGRTAGKLTPLQHELRSIDPDGQFAVVTLDRDSVSAADLGAIGCCLVVDCSGPFQAMGTNLIEAAIAAGYHYVDLADSRAFIAEIGAFDARARAAGVAVISGASSSPGLSNAVLDSLLAGWQSIDSIDCAIVPGNQTPKGRSVIEGILSWVGQPVRVFRQGAWQVGAGWSAPRWVTIAGLTRRRAALADVPDLDVIPARFAPRVRAGFDAGMELSILNWLIALCGLPVRWGVIGSARIFSGLGSLIANALDSLGSRDGGMLIEAVGIDADGAPRRVQWQLKASGGDGPYVPVGPAAAIVEKLLLAGDTTIGASSAAGLVTIADIAPWYGGLAIEMAETTLPDERSLYRQILGEAFALLPAVTQRIHRGRPAIVAEGEAVVMPASSGLGRLIARCFGLPVVAGTVPVRVVIESGDGREYWTRSFGGHRMGSVMRAKDGLIEERFGPVAIAMRLLARADGLDMLPLGGNVLGMPLPRFLLPVIKAEERVDGADRHLFEVDIGLPIVGRLVAYRGHLEV